MTTLPVSLSAQSAAEFSPSLLRCITLLLGSIKNYMIVNLGIMNSLNLKSYQKCIFVDETLQTLTLLTQIYDM